MHPEFSHFTFEAVLDGEDVVKIFHGGDVYKKDLGFDMGDDDTSQTKWHEYIGHYCTHNPWFPSFRIVYRGGQLIFIEPSGTWYTLIPTENNNIFNLADPRELPEWIEFDPPVEGRVLRVLYSGCEYFRSFVD